MSTAINIHKAILITQKTNRLESGTYCTEIRITTNDADYVEINVFHDTPELPFLPSKQPNGRAERS
jgi:hypothetical protein|tara:strand:- start:586 stop:783 length:198 start_codon:yes stop_codon:yes gene_type:complete